VLVIQWRVAPFDCRLARSPNGCYGSPLCDGGRYFFAGEVMRQEGVEAGRRLRLPTVAFRDDSFEGVNEYDEGKQSMTWTLSMLRELL
jgi:hypothetical protein